MSNKIPAGEAIDRLFNPGQIAVIGASDKPGRIGRIVMDYLEKSSAQLFPVNPKLNIIGDRPVFTSIDDLPNDMDLAVIAVNARVAVESAEALARKGTANIIIIAGGFGEVGDEGRELEARLKKLPGLYGSRILGPNSLGVFIPAVNLDTIFVEHGDRALAEGGGIAFITQSGSVGVESLGLASNTGFGLRAFVGIGNKVDLSEADFLPWFGRDRETRCLALYVESIEGGRTFLEDARMISREKPVVLLKAGRTSAGISAVSSHTGRLAGSDKVVSGALRQYGIQRAMDDEELCDAAKVLSMAKPARGNRVAVISSAGGFGVMCTDYIDSPHRRANLSMAVFSEETRQRIAEKNLPFASSHNPVDLTAGATDQMFLDTLEALGDDDGVDIIIFVALFSPPTVTDELLPRMASMIKEIRKPVLVISQYGPFTDDHLKRFYKEGVAGYPSISRVVRAARFLVERANLLRQGEE
jgi:acyl-CoA synthetase (NDP forming)